MDGTRGVHISMGRGPLLEKTTGRDTTGTPFRPVLHGPVSSPGLFTFAHTLRIQPPSYTTATYV